MILNAQQDRQVVAAVGDGREAVAEAEKISQDVVITGISCRA